MKMNFIPDPNKPMPPPEEIKAQEPDVELASRLVEAALAGHEDVAKALNTLGAAMQLLLMFQADHGSPERAANNCGLIATMFLERKKRFELADKAKRAHPEGGNA